jgi:hypothetical protein
MKDITRIGGWDIHTYTIHDFGYNQMATSKTNLAKATRYIDNKQKYIQCLDFALVLLS